jgi:hypothetical protein
MPYLGAISIETPDVSGQRAIVHFILFLLCFYFGFISNTNRLRKKNWFGLPFLGRLSSYVRNWPRRSATFVAAYGSTKVAVLAPSPGTVTGCVIVALAALVTASPKVTTAAGVHPPGPMLTS